MPQLRREELAIPDYEHLPLGTLQHRIRALAQEQLRDLIAYEEAHARRVPVLEVMQQRLTSLEEGAQPSSGDQTITPEAPPAPRGGSPVREAGQSPPSSPPPHGIPPNRADPKGTARSDGWAQPNPTGASTIGP